MQIHLCSVNMCNCKALEVIFQYSFCQLLLYALGSLVRCYSFQHVSVLTEIVKGLWSCFFSCLCRHWCTVETMESMLNKLKSTVTKVTADVTSAVMGNPVTREFDVGRHIASGGNGLAWKIFNGTKKSTKQVGCQVKTYVYKH